MKKVINITLSSIVFAIEEDAHAVLAEYLEAITQRIAAHEDKDEIMADIEQALAEKFIGAGKSEKLAVTLADVERVQREMGAPAAFGEEDATTTGAPTTDIPQAKKRLFRDTDDAILAGVASGLARYFDIDPVIVRIAFVVAAFLNGIGIIAYIILWVAVPKAETTAQKFAMRGARVTVEDIAARVKKNLSDSDLADAEYVRGAWQGTKGVLERLFAVFGSVIRFCLTVLRVLLGIAGIVLGALGLAALTSAYSIGWLSDRSKLPEELQSILDTVLVEPLGVVLLIAILVLVFIPLLLLILLGVSLLRKHNVLRAGPAVTLAVTWIIALTLAVTAGVMTGQKVYQEVGEHIDVVEYLPEDLEIEITQHGVSVSASGPFVPPVPPLAPEVRNALDGVTLSPTMTKLDLSGRGLTGSLPAEVRFLSRLERVDLSDNNFTGLPAEVGQLTNLRYVNLANNQFTGLPHELGNLQQLETLDLRGNDISTFDLDIIRAALPVNTQILVD